MASAEADIEMVESFTPKTLDDRSSTQESKSEDDDKDKASVGDKNDVHKSDRKIGHRRVGVGGEITYKKIQTTQIMGSIQLGIQHAVGGLASKPERDLLMQDFMTVETTNFPHEGSNHTPAHHYSEFRFRTYAPIAFRYFRDLFGIQPDDFLMSMCSSPLRELSNPGASGSIFYLTDDDEFIIKTVQHKEGEFLQKLLPGYYMNLNQNPRTLLPKFFGLYCYQCNSKNVRLIAMNNLLPSVVKLHQKYDLKGSTYKRKASKSERNKKSPTYKDLDFMEHHPLGLFLEADTYGALVKTIQRDCRVLESFKIMDYSLLVGIHNLDKAQREKAEEHQADGKPEDDGGGGERSMLTRTRSEHKAKEDFCNQVRRTQSINRQRLVAHSTAMESIQAESEPIDEEEDVPPGGIPARNGKGERLLLFVGVIDILQSYRFRKKLEHTWKSMIHDGDTVSVHRPSFYAQRFQDFMAKKVFTKIPSLDLPEIKGNHRKFRTLVTSYIALKHSPSKRKSISRPLRPHEEPDSGAGTSIQPSTEEVQFPRVLWVEPAKPRNQPDTPDDSTLSPKPIFDDSSSYLSPDYPRRRRFSSDTDSSMSSRVPSPFGVSDTFKLKLKSIDIEQDELSDCVYDKDDFVADERLNTSTPKNAKPSVRKISFAVDGNQDEPLRSRSALSSHSSIAEALKDMPFIDNVEDNDRANSEKNITKNHVNTGKTVQTNDNLDKGSKKESTQKDKKVQKKGFFSGIKKALVEFFTGPEELEQEETKNGNNISERRNIEESKSDEPIEIINKAQSRVNEKETFNINTDDANLSNSVVVIESQNGGDDKKEDGFNSSIFAGECSNDDFAIIPYKENRIDIVEDIDVCTDFAEGDEIEPDLEITWKNRRSRSLSKSIGPVKNNTQIKHFEAYKYNSLRWERIGSEKRNIDENSTKKFLDNERFQTNEKIESRDEFVKDNTLIQEISKL